MNAGLIFGCVAPHPPILVPAVAGSRVQRVRRTREAMQRVATEIRRLSPDTLVLVSPHAPINPYAMGVSAASAYDGGFAEFGAQSVHLSFEGDPELASALESECRSFGVPLETIGPRGGSSVLDHGAAVPLYFLHEAGLRCRLALLAFSDLGVETHFRFGRAIDAAIRSVGRKGVLVASGDFSHRLIPGAPAGYSPRAAEFDQTIVSALRSADRDAILNVDEQLLRDAGECGYRSLVIALGAMPEAGIEVLSYEGPFGVGYLVASLRNLDADEGAVAGASAPAGAFESASEAQQALRLARLAVESYVLEGKTPKLPFQAEGFLAERAGVFVSLKIQGELRGCIGTYIPAEPTVAGEILRNAVASASRDPRFLPVTREELPYLHYSVDVLSPPEPVEELSQLDPKIYGVIVQSGARRGLLLPDLEGVATSEIQVEIARRKAGIPDDAKVQLYRFTVRRISEER